MNAKAGMRKSKRNFILLICLGIMLMIAGAVAEHLVDDSSIAGRLAGAGAGFGSGIAALGAVLLILINRNPEQVREQEINEKDERFIRIRERSAQGTWYITLFSLVALEITFLCLDYKAPLFAVLVVMAVHVFGYLALLYRNSKTM